MKLMSSTPQSMTSRDSAASCCWYLGAQDVSNVHCPDCRHKHSAQVLKVCLQAGSSPGLYSAGCQVTTAHRISEGHIVPSLYSKSLFFSQHFLTRQLTHCHQPTLQLPLKTCRSDCTHLWCDCVAGGEYGKGKRA